METVSINFELMLVCESETNAIFAGYYSPEQIAADALTYNQCMQSAENSQIPSTTVLHQGTQLGHPTNLSPVNQVSNLYLTYCGYLVTRFCITTLVFLLSR